MFRTPLGAFGEGGAAPPAYSYSGTIQDVAFTDSPGTFTEAVAYQCSAPTAQLPQQSALGGAGQLYDFSRSARANLTRTPPSDAGVGPTDIAHELCGLRLTGDLSGAVYDCVAEADVTPAECSGPLSLNRGYAIYWSTLQRLDNSSDPWPFASVKGFKDMFAADQHGCLFVANENRAPWFITGETLTVEVVRVWTPLGT